MATAVQDPALSADNLLPAQHGPSEPLPKLMLGAVGVVYGDIGTSPLYAMKESFLGPHPLSVDRLHIYGVLSLIFWSLMLIVTSSPSRRGRSASTCSTAAWSRTATTCI